jgi:hypothetical protein
MASIKTDTNTAPAYGDAITKKDKAMAKAPAPMLNPLAQTGLSLLPSPFTTWEILVRSIICISFIIKE